MGLLKYSSLAAMWSFFFHDWSHVDSSDYRDEFISEVMSEDGWTMRETFVDGKDGGFLERHAWEEGRMSEWVRSVSI